MERYCKRCQHPLDQKYRCQNCNKLKLRAKREANRELFRKKDKEWYWNNLEKARERRRDVSPEKRKEYNSRNYNKNKQTFIECNNRRRARLAGAKGSHTKQDWFLLCKTFNGMCVRCYEVKTLTKDHIVPLSMGGSDFLSNIQPLCKRCNSIKRDKTEYYSYWFMVA